MTAPGTVVVGVGRLNSSKQFIYSDFYLRRCKFQVVQKNGNTSGLEFIALRDIFGEDINLVFGHQVLLYGALITFLN